MPALPEPSEDADFSSQLEKHQPALRRFLLSVTASHDASADILQETNTLLWQKRHHFEPGTNFQAWAFRIAFLQAKNHLRKAARRGRREVVADGLLDSIAAEQAPPDRFPEATRHALARCLARLRSEHRHLILRRYFNRVPVETLATEAGSNPNALAQKLHRIRARLLACIQAETASDR